MSSASSAELFDRFLSVGSGSEREQLIKKIVLEENCVPPALGFVPVQLVAGTTTVTLHVLSDYLCVGTDKDHVRIPMWPSTAQAIADAWDCMLPTTKVVDLIWTSATTILVPSPYSPKQGLPGRGDIRTYYTHDETIAKQLRTQFPGWKLSDLTAGHKKDVVITNSLKSVASKSVAIYGWHQKNGKPIQPLFTGHAKNYVDYSHGIRLVRQTCQLNGVDTPLSVVMSDPKLGPMFSSTASPQTVYRYTV